MSVLIEALSLVVKRQVLDVSYPGGAAGFIESMGAPSCPARHVCADDGLVSVSFFDPESALPVSSSLVELGLVEVDDQSFYDMAFVDQAVGPTMPCPWLEWEQHTEGFTYAWLAGTEPGELVAPAHWTADDSRRLTRSDVRDIPGRTLRLSRDETGIETWLDFATGRINRSLGTVPPQRGTSEPVLHPTARLMAVLTDTLQEDGLRFISVGDTAVSLPMRGRTADFSLYISIDVPRGYVICFATLAARAPLERRSAVSEAISRANWDLCLGNFEMDASDGEIHLRLTTDAEGDAFTPTRVRRLIGAAIAVADKYHDALMQVMFGGADPASAIAAVS